MKSKIGDSRTDSDDLRAGIGRDQRAATLGAQAGLAGLAWWHCVRSATSLAKTCLSRRL